MKKNEIETTQSQIYAIYAEYYEVFLKYETYKSSGGNSALYLYLSVIGAGMTLFITLLIPDPANGAMTGYYVNFYGIPAHIFYFFLIAAVIFFLRGGQTIEKEIELNFQTESAKKVLVKKMSVILSNLEKTNHNKA